MTGSGRKTFHSSGVGGTLLRCGKVTIDLLLCVIKSYVVEKAIGINSVVVIIKNICDTLGISSQDQLHHLVFKDIKY